MKAFWLILFIFIFTTCSQRKTDSLLWLFPLLGNTNTTQSLPDEPTNPVAVTVPTSVQLTILPPESTETLCPTYGGLFIQYIEGEERTCSPSEQNASCVSVKNNENGLPIFLDPRSYVGIEFPTTFEVGNHLFPKDKKSSLFCFLMPIPTDSSHMEMYSFQNQSNNASLNNCYYNLTETRCVDTFPLLGSARFTIPKEFPIDVSDGNGHAGSHTLELKFVTDDDLFTTCIYIGNEHSKLPGFTANAYIAGNSELKGKTGYCIQCESNYCNSIDPVTGLITPSVQVNRFIIPVGERFTVKNEISLSVIKGQGPFKHTTRWTIENFQQIISFEELSVLPASSIFLLWFIVPTFVMIFYFYHKKWKHLLKKKTNE
ncbi:hypothetical protein EHQ23_04115 [Leptospira bourretii]|uniref:Uncharacterized protein n=1 Tax=Leptospira bourretii TaxID=2484962 RepID=A0A4R9IJU5_9LEPT|nr:hypothetical protein [Leptospira bourretii]TGK88038.1 hypothetical protein EHQ23_04115 [Leptospira bourretii]TGK88688.1 hypothetical protein EHQ26_16640 [Leptospira bourretii]TGL33478.1 hypothetical protein EHQ45_09900 [Leptospira bourretii]